MPLGNLILSDLIQRLEITFILVNLIYASRGANVCKCYSSDYYTTGFYLVYGLNETGFLRRL